MPTRKGKATKERIVPYSLEVLELPCEWESCSVVLKDMAEYMKHIETYHLTGLSDEDLHCHWKDCEAFTEELSDLYRHILFHAFHTKIKCYGRNLQQRKKLPACTLDIASRNVIPELPDPLTCCWDACEDVFENPELFYRHLDYHVISCTRKESQDDVSVCLWQGCSRDFANHYKVRDHMRSHTQEKQIACPTCGGMFATRTKFLDHIQRQIPVNESKGQVFQCEYCSRKMKTQRLLRDHQRHHVNHYKCPYCEMTCPTPSGLQTHVLYRHSKEKPFSCQYCDYKCKSQRDLRKHLETHSTELSFKCPFEDCDYATRSNACYTNHMRRKHEMNGKLPSYACHICPKKFARGNYLTHHLTVRHKFRWPSGHTRFRYQPAEDGVFRLQTVRYESIEIPEDVDAPDAVNTSSNVDTQASACNSESTEVSLNGVHQSMQSNELSGGANMTLYYSAEESSQQSVAIAVTDMSQQTTATYQEVFFEIMDTGGKQLVTVDGAPIVLLEFPSSGQPGGDLIPSIQIVQQEG